MKKSRNPLILIVVAVVFVILSCNALSGQPTVSNIRMATDETGKTTTTSYSAADPFFVFADLSELKTGSVVVAKWYAVNAAGVAVNSEINTSDYSYQPGIGFVYFKLTTSDGGDWPVGSYRVEIYLDGALIGQQAFTVQ